MISGQLHSAREISNQLMQMSEAAPEPVSLLIAQGATGGYHMYSGAFGKAQQHLIRSLALYDLQQHRHLAYQVGDDPGVMYRCFLAWTLWFLGYPDQAMATLREAQKLAQELDIPSLTGGVLYTGMLFFHLSRQPDKVQEYSGQTIRLEDENGRFYWGAAIQIFQGWALSCTGQGSEGIARAAQGIQQLQAIGFNLWHSYKLAVLVEAYMNAGRLGNAYRTVNEALAAAGQFGSHWYDAELYRLKGMLTLQSQASLGQVAGESAESQRAKSKRQKSEKRDPQSLILDSQGEAEACFLKAIAIGRQQQAKSLELRAVMSLVRLRKEQAQHATHSMQHAARNLLTEAHQMLAEIYNWFTEGFDTKDLQEAKALLESLSP
jgi:adenylate cyclase